MIALLGGSDGTRYATATPAQIEPRAKPTDSETPRTGLASVWVGVALAYLYPSLPPSSAIIGVAVTFYAAAYAATWRRG